MNCDEFSQVMHQRLDHRESIDDDGDLSRHARRCESCRAQLEAWRQIASIMPRSAPVVSSTTTSLPSGRLPVADDGSTPRRVVLAAAGLAAAVLLIVVLVRDDSIAPDDSQSVSSVAVDEGIRPGEAVLAQSTGQLDPALWWQDVQQRDWVGRTMPTVKLVREGVAPIGRSLMRAVTILTIGGRDQTS